MKFRWHHLSEHSLWNILFYYFLSSLYMRPVCGYFTGLDKLPSVPSANSAAYGHPGQTQKHGTSQSTCWHLPSTFQNCLTFPSFTVDNTIDFMCSMVIVIEITMYSPPERFWTFLFFLLRLNSKRILINIRLEFKRNKKNKKVQKRSGGLYMVISITMTILHMKSIVLSTVKLGNVKQFWNVLGRCQHVDCDVPCFCVWPGCP